MKDKKERFLQVLNTLATCPECFEHFKVTGTEVLFICPKCRHQWSNRSIPNFTQMTMEEYTNWINSQNEGKKFDQNKLRWDLFPADAAEEIIKVLMFGAKKYDDWNWSKGIKFSRLFAAIMRHMWAWFHGETNDPETGLNHLAHAGCCIVFLLSYSRRADYVQKYDDRPEYYQEKIDLGELREVKKDGS